MRERSYKMRLEVAEHENTMLMQRLAQALVALASHTGAGTRVGIPEDLLLQPRRCLHPDRPHIPVEERGAALRDLNSFVGRDSKK